MELGMLNRTKFPLIALVAGLLLSAAIIVVLGPCNGCSPATSRRVPGPTHPAVAAPIVGPWTPRYTELLASSIADRLTERAALFRAEHGAWPTVDDFWKGIDTTPIHNPLNGSAIIVKLGGNADPARVGWLLDEVTGRVYPGVLFHYGLQDRPATTRPTGD
jgi:hypothetical protein